MKERHSVRRYKEIPIEKDKLDILFAEVEKCNRESGLHIQLVTDEPKAFTGALASYGHFSGVSNYIALVGKKSDTLDETAGYYGEHLVLLAQMLGLNTCWVALTFSKRKARFDVGKGEKLVCVISLGYGDYQGKPHKNRPLAEICPDNPLPKTGMLYFFYDLDEMPYDPSNASSCRVIYHERVLPTQISANNAFYTSL